MSEVVILIVDDNADDCFLIRRLLRSYALEFTRVEQVDSVAAALAFMQAQMPSCCLLDYHLPDQDGLDFLKYLRRQSDLQNVPVVVLTGQGDEKIAVEMMQSGAQDYLVKNQLSSESLYRAIKNAMRACQLQDQLTHLAHYDGLTGVLNRNLFLNRLQQAIERSNRYHYECALFYLDIDYFKHINDTLGHDAGDILLRTVASRLRESCRASDSVGRLGGDEFVVLMENIDAATAHYLAQKLLTVLGEPVDVGIQVVQVNASIGLAHYPSTARDANELLRQADEALYTAKRNGRAQYVKFSLAQKAIWERRQILERVLPAEIAAGNLSLQFQPIISIATQQPVAVEALSRWCYEHYEVSAEELLGLVHRLNLLPHFDVWLVSQAFAQLRSWYAASAGVRMCINIHAADMQNGGLLQALTQGLEQFGLEPAMIELDFTETTLMRNPERSIEFLGKLRREGYHVSIDDFGVGYSSLSYLSEMPVSRLKIDRRFVLDLETNEAHQRTVQAIVALGHSLGLEVLAEGVETPEQWHLIRQYGCDLAQGFWLGRPENPGTWAGVLAALPTRRH